MKQKRFRAKVGILDDEPLALKTFAADLQSHFDVLTSSDPQEMENWLGIGAVDVVLLDWHLGSLGDGRVFFRKWNASYPHVPIIFCSGERVLQRALECVREKAFDYIAKPYCSKKLIETIKRATAHLKKLGSHPTPWGSPYICASPAMRKLALEIEKLKGAYNLNILIEGESGVGKEGVAKWINQQQDQRRPFVSMNAAAIMPSLFESELMGHEAGSFTGATQKHKGLIEAAHGGDLFLDEIAEMPLDQQSKLLRVFQEKEVRPVGGKTSSKLQFRLISATNVSLKSRVERGQFREDLYYRIAEWTLRIPPLRERPEDILPLSQFFVQKYSCKKHMSFHPGVEVELLSHSWPGNVRELESLIKRSLLFAPPSEHTLDRLAWGHQPSPSALGWDNQLKSFERSLLKRALIAHQGEVEKAQRSLGISRATFYRKIKALGL